MYRHGPLLIALVATVTGGVGGSSAETKKDPPAKPMTELTYTFAEVKESIGFADDKTVAFLKAELENETAAIERIQGGASSNPADAEERFLAAYAVPDLKAIDEAVENFRRDAQICRRGVCVQTDCIRTNDAHQKLLLLSGELSSLQYWQGVALKLLREHSGQLSSERDRKKAHRDALASMRKLQLFYHELANALLNIADIANDAAEFTVTKELSFSLSNAHELANQILNLIGLLDQTRTYLLRIWPDAPLPDWFQKGGTFYQIAADAKNVLGSLVEAVLHKAGVFSDLGQLKRLGYSAGQLAAKLLALVSAKSIDQMQNLVDQYDRLVEVERAFYVGFNVEVQRLVKLQEATEAARKRVVAAAQATEECLKSCSPGEVLRNPNPEDDPEWLKKLRTSYEGLKYSVSRDEFYKYKETVEHFLPALRYYRDRTKLLTRQVLTAHAGFSVSLIDPQDPAAPERCRQQASPAPANPDPMEGLKSPQAEFPDLPVLPARFCSLQEKLDYDRTVLNPVLDQASKLFKEYSHYDSELGIRLQKIKNSLALMHPDDTSQALRIETLEKQRDKLLKLQADFAPAWLKAKDTSPQFTKLSARFLDTPVEECGPPAPLNIFFPTLPETFCSEKERDDFVAQVEALLAEVKKYGEARRAYMQELMTRRSVAPDQILKASLTKEINEAMIVNSEGDQTVSALYELLDKAKALEIGPCIDPCLVGSWEARKVKGFAGIRVTFKSDGTETVDYTAAQPMVLGPNDQIVWSGVATAKITTPENKTAKIVEAGSSNVLLRFTVMPAPFDLKDRLGVGGLGGTTGDNAYVCTEDTLTYQGTMHRDQRPNFDMNLTRLE